MDFVQLYYGKFQDKELKKAYNLWSSAKHIRNASAHNAVFLINMFDGRNQLRKIPATFKSIIPEIGISSKRARQVKVNDMMSLFVLLKAYASPTVLEHTKADGKTLLERALRRKSNYSNVSDLAKMYDIINKLIDYL
jgi:hypothetical protein